ncbi:MAG: alpha-E domain-containing protein [Pseudomonadota bacterium]
MNWDSLLRAVTHLTQTYPGFVGDNDEDDQEKLTKPETELFSVFLDPERGGSLSFNLQSLLYAAHNVRDRLSTDIWRMFNDIETGLERLQARRAHFSAEDPWMLSAALEQLNDLVTSFAAFSGFSMDGLTHGQGWRFLMMGRRLERAQQGVYLLRATLSNPISDEPTMLEHLLTVFDCLMTYRRRYRTQPQIEAVLYLLFQDENNPRSLAYQLRHLNDDVQKLPRENSNYRSAEERFVLDSLTRIRLAEVPDLSRSTGQPAFRKNLDQLLARQTRLLNSISETLSNAYFSHTKQPHQLVALLKPKNID